jgi:hypothetical protein
MARSRRVSEAESGEFDDVLDGKPAVVSDGGPYVYHFSRIDRDRGHEHPLLDMASPSAAAIQVDVATIGAHFSAFDAAEPAFVGGCVVVMDVVSGERRAEMSGYRAPNGSDAAMLLLYRAVQAMFEPDVHVELPRPLDRMLKVSRQHLLDAIEAMPQHSARILDRGIHSADDVRAIRTSDARELGRLVAVYEEEDAVCQRDVMYAAFEASFARAYRGDARAYRGDGESGDGPRETVIRLRAPGVRLDGVVGEYDGEVLVKGSFFTTAYVASSGKCRTALDFLSRFNGRRQLLLEDYAPRDDAARFFAAARAAMKMCNRLAGGSGMSIAYPRIDPIVTYSIQPDDARWSLVECARKHALPVVPSIECTLDGTYVFGRTAVGVADMMSALSRVLEASAGDAAWRARGLLAPNLKAAAKRSVGIVGESVATCVHVYELPGGAKHTVCAALRVVRDASDRVVRADILLRGSYDEQPDMQGLLLAPELQGAPGTVRWVARYADRESLLWKWETQRSEGSCTVHAAMLALKIAQRLVDGHDDVESAMEERCHVAFAAVCKYALSTRAEPQPRASRISPRVQVDGSLMLVGAPRAGPMRKSDFKPLVEEVEKELRAMARRASRALVVRCRPGGTLLDTMLDAGFRREGPFVRKDYT